MALVLYPARVVYEKPTRKETKMAEIKVKGKITKVHPSFLLVRESHSKKDPQNNWYVASLTTYQVWIPESQRSQAWEMDGYVEVEGRFKTETNERDGKSYVNNVISANTIQISEPFAKKTSAPVEAPSVLSNEDALPF
jgi:hypothetical protein